MRIEWNELIQNKDEEYKKFKFRNSDEALINSNDNYGFAEFSFKSFFIKINNFPMKEFMNISNSNIASRKKVLNKIWWWISKEIFIHKSKTINLFKMKKYELRDSNKKYFQVNYEELESIDFVAQREIYINYLINTIDDWSTFVNELHWWKTFNSSYKDFGIKKGDLHLIIQDLIDNLFLEEKGPGNLRPTSKLRTYNNVEKNNFVFIAMKFDGNDERHKIIEDTVKEMKLIPIRADSINETGVITEQIFREIKKSYLMICDVSDNNQGAYFEAGYAMALDKKVLFISKEGEGKTHFDINHYRRIDFKYDTKENLGTKLKEYL